MKYVVHNNPKGYLEIDQYEHDIKVGYATIAIKKGYIGLGTIEINENYRRRGYGRLLISYIARRFGKPIRLWTGFGEESIKFYEALGFEVEYLGHGDVHYILR